MLRTSMSHQKLFLGHNKMQLLQAHVKLSLLACNAILLQPIVIQDITSWTQKPTPSGTSYLVQAPNMLNIVIKVSYKNSRMSNSKR